MNDACDDDCDHGDIHNSDHDGDNVLIADLPARTRDGASRAKKG